MRSDARVLAAATTHERVRWSDIDAMGVVYFGRYLRFMESAEAELFRTLGFTYTVLAEQFGVWLARVRLEMNYRLPARLDDEIACTAALVRAAASSLHLTFPLERVADGAQLVEGKLVLACVAAETLRPSRIPAPLRAAIDAAAADGAR